MFCVTFRRLLPDQTGAIGPLGHSHCYAGGLIKFPITTHQVNEMWGTVGATNSTPHFIVKSD